MGTDRRRTMSRREMLKLAAGAAGAGTMASILAACGAAPATAPAGSTGGAAAPAPQAGVATISMIGWGSPLEKENVDKGLQLFQSQNPDVKVEWIHTPQDYATKLQTMLAGGTPPDLLWANAILDYVARDVILDVTDRIKADPVLGKADYFIEPQETERSTWNGRWYGIGSCWVLPHLYYNVDLLEKAGVEPPSTDAAKAWTWDQFLENARKLTIDVNGRHPGEDGFDGNNVEQWGVSWATWSLMRDVLVYSNDGDAFTPEHTTKLGEPAAIEAIQALADLAAKHQVAPQATTTEQLGISSQQMLASGKLAILADGSWALQDIAKLGFRYGCGVLPKLKTAVTAAQAHLHAIHKDTKSPDAAWKLLAYLSSDEYQRGLCKAGLWLPSHTNLLTEEGLATWITPDVHPEGYQQIATDYLANHARNYFFPAGFQEADRLIATALDPVWIGQATAADVLTPELIQQVNDVLQKALADLPK
jgi:multiple sugar transport system substrate-binding protein